MNTGITNFDTTMHPRDVDAPRFLFHSIPRGWRTPLGLFGVVSLLGYNFGTHPERLWGREVAGIDVSVLLNAWKYCLLALVVLFLFFALGVF